MTDATASVFAAQDARHLARLKPWQAKVVKLISRKVSDATAHAHLAVTEALRAIPDGRPSAARTRRSPSYQAALVRLDELLASLAGPSVSSLKGVVRDAAEAFYRDSFNAMLPTVSEDIRVSNTEPTQAGISKIRGALLHSVDLRTELGSAVERAKRSLGPAVVSAANRGVTKTQGKDTIDTWHAQTERAITQAALGALSDRNVAAQTLAMLDVIHPSRLDKASLAASSHKA